jgi:hypothetical protein
MANITPKNFPGVYTSITDQSLTAVSTSRFQPGLIGVASRGPFDTPIPIPSVQAFVATFGQPVPGSFLGTALGIIAPFTNGATVVRVGGQYQPFPGGLNYPATGSVGNNYFISQGAPMLNPAISPTGNVFVQITQTGKVSTINAQVLNVSGSFGTLATATLSDTYTNGQVGFSYYVDAASNAQGRLDGYIYETINLGTIAGTKGQYYFTVTATPTNLAVGNLITITQPGLAPTQEVYVAVVNPLIGGSAVIQLQATNDSQRGYQTLSLQANYTNAVVQLVVAKAPALYFYALTAGTWANTAIAGIAPTATSGLQVNVSPGSNPGTKKITIYWNSAAVEIYDNLGYFTTPSGATDFATTINTTTPSQYITIQEIGTIVPANTVNPWNLSATNSIVGAPTNDAAPGDAGSVSGGFNGENAQAADFVGYYNPITDAHTGLKAFEDLDNVYITHVCAPGVTSTDASSLPVHLQMATTAQITNAVGLIDIPANNPTTFPVSVVASLPLTIWNAIDWVNGTGQFASRGVINSYYLAAFFNWFNMIDPITGLEVLAPPTIGALRAMAYTWLNDQPWYVAAGMNRGVINEALSVSWPRISSSAKEASYVAGQTPINLILQSNGIIMLYGDLTLMRIPVGDIDKLTAIHNLELVEFVVQGMAAIGRTKVFDPNDLTLLNTLQLAWTQFLDSVKNLRGIDAYFIDLSANTTTTRALREIIVNLQISPTDAVEKIYIIATVLQTGAIINSVQTVQT